MTFKFYSEKLDGMISISPLFVTKYPNILYFGCVLIYWEVGVKVFYEQ